MPKRKSSSSRTWTNVDDLAVSNARYAREGMAAMRREDVVKSALQDRFKFEQFSEDADRQREQSYSRGVQNPDGSFSLLTQKQMAVRDKAQYDAANFETRYTAKQKAEITSGRAALQQFKNDPRNSNEQKAEAERLVSMREMGILPVMQPRLSPYPQGQGIGDVWQSQSTGEWLTRKANGESIEHKSATLTAKHALDLELIKQGGKEKLAALKARAAIATEEIQAGFELNAKGEQVPVMRKRNEAEIQRELSRQFGGQPSAAPQSQGKQPAFDYSKIPAGSTYRAPDGKMRIKPGVQERNVIPSAPGSEIDTSDYEEDQ